MKNKELKLLMMQASTGTPTFRFCLSLIGVFTEDPEMPEYFEVVTSIFKGGTRNGDNSDIMPWARKRFEFMPDAMAHLMTEDRKNVKVLVEEKMLTFQSVETFDPFEEGYPPEGVQV